MRTFEATCRIVTPLFMGGASQQAELRTQSINGVLRWWFRVAGGSLEDEKRIFGWAGETSNQGIVRIFIKEPTFQSQPFPSGQPGSDYLGFSLKLTRRLAVPENKKFDLKISFHPKATDDDIKKFFSALWLAFNLGNFGSRARRGFGAIRIEKIEKDKQDITENCFDLNFIPNRNLESWIKGNLEKIKEILKPNPRKYIPYLFENFEIYNFKSDNSWQNLLNEVGIKYKNFRQNERLNDRIVFGLPIIAVRKYKRIRRASPLIFKVINIDKNNYTLLIITINPKTRKFTFHPDIKEDVKWDLLTNFVKSIRRIYP
jgi:CRISPR-associated protein Cmr1